MSDSQSLRIAVVTVSDTRTEETDKSGRVLIDCLKDSGHLLKHKSIIKDDVYLLRAEISQLIADSQIQAILMTGGTGFTARDNTQIAIKPLFDSHIEGFGELFRQLSYEEIGTSTIQSRVFARFATNCIIFCLPGSPGSCLTCWTTLISSQLDSSFNP